MITKKFIFLQTLLFKFCGVMLISKRIIQSIMEYIDSGRRQFQNTLSNQFFQFLHQLRILVVMF